MNLMLASQPSLWSLLWPIPAFALAYILGSILHELAHYAFFKRYGLPVVELSFGIVRLFFIEGRIKPLLTLNRPFDFLCSCKGLRGIDRRKRALCLLSGGLTNLVLAIMLAALLVLVQTEVVKALMYVQIIACAANTCVNTLNPYSADRKLLRRLNIEDTRPTRGGG